MKPQATKKDWMEFWFWIRQIEGRPVSPRKMTDEEKKDLLEWMKIGPKYNWDSLAYLNDLLQNGST